MPLAEWAEEFLSLARRLSPTTQETYRRDLDKYVLPRFGAYRLGRLPADEIENWLNDEIAAGVAPSSVHRHYRTLRRMLPGRRREAEDPRPTRATGSSRRGCRQREMVFLAWDAGGRPGRGARRALSGADLPRRRLRDALERARRAATGPGRPAQPQGPSHRAAGPTPDRGVAAQGAEDPAVVRSITISRVTADACWAATSRRSPTRAGWARLPERRWQSAHLVELLEQPLRSGPAPDRSVLPLSRPPTHQRGPGHRRRRPPQGHPDRGWGTRRSRVTLDRYGHLFPELDEALATSFGARLVEARDRRSQSTVVHAAFGQRPAP